MQQQDEIGPRLSALADGELGAQDVHAACTSWRDDRQARAHWHAYHLIGDVLRSNALASDAGHDERFLRRLRERLAAEPAVLAAQALPTISPAARRESVRWRWLAPAAVAAGFVAVASVLIVTRGTLPAAVGDGAVLARASSPGRTVVAPAVAPLGPAVEGEGSIAAPAVADREFVRDARLDRYLAAHMEFGGSSVLGAPSGFLRAATSRTPDR